MLLTTQVKFYDEHKHEMVKLDYITVFFDTHLTR